jgi:hypothetical protein
MKRREAKALGLSKYVTGKPCKHGHFSERYTKSAQCLECVKAQNIVWREANPDKHVASMKKWWLNNKELHNTRVKRWQSLNKDKIKQAAKLWAKNNPDKVKEKTLRYIKKHPDAYTARAVRGVIARAKRVPKWLTSGEKWMVREAYHLSKLRTKLFGFVWEVDHILPLRGATVSGLHVPSNLQVIPKAQNRQKRNNLFLA